MNYDNLPEKIQLLCSDMRHYSSTLQEDVDQALEGAYDLEDFITNVENCMISIADEARRVANVFTEAFKKHKKSQKGG